MASIAHGDNASHVLLRAASHQLWSRPETLTARERAAPSRPRRAAARSNLLRAAGVLAVVVRTLQLIGIHHADLKLPGLQNADQAVELRVGFLQRVDQLLPIRARVRELCICRGEHSGTLVAQPL